MDPYFCHVCKAIYKPVPDRSAVHFQCTEVHTSVHFNDTLLLKCIALHSQVHCTLPCTSEFVQCMEVLHCTGTANALHWRCTSIWGDCFSKVMILLISQGNRKIAEWLRFLLRLSKKILRVCPLVRTADIDLY